MLQRVLPIQVPCRDASLIEEESSCWTMRFNTIIEHLSAVLGEVIKVGHWIGTDEGRVFRSECTDIVREAFQSTPSLTRVVDAWGASLLCVRKIHVMVFNFILDHRTTSTILGMNDTGFNTVTVTHLQYPRVLKTGQGLMNYFFNKYTL